MDSSSHVVWRYGVHAPLTATGQDELSATTMAKELSVLLPGQYAWQGRSGLVWKHSKLLRATSSTAAIGA
jgi:hypothetical protein